MITQVLYGVTAEGDGNPTAIFADLPQAEWYAAHAPINCAVSVAAITPVIVWEAKPNA